MPFSRATSSSPCWTWLQGCPRPASPRSCPAVPRRPTTPHPVSQNTRTTTCSSLRLTAHLRVDWLMLNGIIHTVSSRVTCILIHSLPLWLCPGTPATPATPANIVQGLPDWASQISNTDTVAAVAQILQSPQGQQVGTKPQPSSTLFWNTLCLLQ